MPVNVDAATPLLVVGVVLVFSDREIEVTIVAARLVGLGAGAADFVDEKLTQSEGIVADDFGGKSVARLSGDELVVGVAFAELGRAKR